MSAPSSSPSPRLAAAVTRLGSESAFEVLARAETLKRQGRDVINLGIGQPDFPTPPHVIEAAIKAHRDGHHGYTPANGILPLREAVAADLETRLGAKVDPDCVVIVPGGKMTMFFAVLMLGEPGTEIVYPDPGFPIYESLIRFVGAKPVPMVLREANGFSFDADEVLALLTPATRLLILNSPANPTGGAVPKAEMDRLVAGLDRHPRVAILSDEIYGRIVYGGCPHASLLAYPQLRDRLILLDGWSKTYAMTGWRLGFGVWPQAWIETVTRLAVNSHSCVNAPAQWAGIAALRGPQDAVAAMVRAFDERRRAIVATLNQVPGVRCAEPGGAFYVFPNITGTGLSSRALQDRLLEEAAVATISGTAFGNAGEGFLRLSYAANLSRIAEAMDRFRKLLSA
ncbi:MAG: pyridoxal phosphate-dependent aminotransferase [Alphaproteobacteria bacterium]|nr:pyridoxal phosphate-dependent aminotransferase [Alphaproteobacteria bacterium]MBM3951994.1 pyridoxal phosphate-dependent aminotransferase [Rhodospirillales bacterium]